MISNRAEMVELEYNCIDKFQILLNCIVAKHLFAFARYHNGRQKMVFVSCALFAIREGRVNLEGWNRFEILRGQ